MGRQGGQLVSDSEPFGLLYTWWRGDPLPELPPLPGLRVEPLDNDHATKAGIDLEVDEVRERTRQGHRLYVARLDGQLVAWGWSAFSTAAIGELGLAIVLPPGNHYLWDFVTLPARRGRGIYPHMLQAMLGFEGDIARFWVGHDDPNVASGRGILKSGFQLVGELYRSDEGSFHLSLVGDPDRTLLGASILGVPMSN